MDKLTEPCSCIDEYGDAGSWCGRCNGTGEVITDEGYEILRFIRKYLFADIDN